MSIIFKLPDLGEGLPDAEIHEWHVNVGDEVKVDQLLVSMETAKAVVEVPSPRNGRIAKLYGNTGDVITTGNPLVEFADAEPVKNAATSVSAEAIKKADEPSPVSSTSSAATVAGSIQVGDTVIHEAALGVDVGHEKSGRIKTLPVIRVIAQKLGLDLAKMPATGKHGEVSLDDLCHVIKQQFSNSSIAASQPASQNPNMKPIKGVRKAMAASMAQSHASVVPVTLSDIADLSAWEAGSDFSIRLIRAICVACRIEPVMNAYFDGHGPSIEIKSDIHIGLAVDSDDGLFVPVIKNADKLAPNELRNTINRFKEQVKNRTIPQDELRGATITLSNFGVFAGYFANPVVVPPMVTIIGAGRGRDEVVAVNGKMEIHRMLPLSVTFDHRAATGGEASRFLKAMIDDLALVI
ncbi:MAG: 2-oxo acid dehydrogenase subunit E2 [Legionellales bacterium]|nr:2-oxo acid dehydrogenase subunit E2 [Legionellales bacterium]